jgi:hypothetical protein
MNSKLAVFLLSTFIVLFVFTPGQAEIEWTLHKTFKTQQPPRDVETSVNGKWVFVLTEKGKILVYASNGMLRDSIDVGDSIDSIKAGPREDILFLSSRTDSTVQLITLDFIQNIDVLDSPFKGPAGAQIAIAVFSDFQ